VVAVDNILVGHDARTVVALVDMVIRANAHTSSRRS
jgi:hypothetical protein